MRRKRVQGRWGNEQCSEVRCLADNAAGRVHSVELGGEGAPCETTVQAVLHAPGSALVSQSEAVATPGMTDEIVDGAEAIKRAAELTSEEGMEAPTTCDGCSDLE